MAKVRRLANDRRRRMVALLRDRDGGACWLCAMSILEGAETLEHLLSRSLGGLNVPGPVAPYRVPLWPDATPVL